MNKNKDENEYKPPWRDKASQHGGGWPQKTTAKDDRGDAWDPSKRLTQDHPREVRKPDATGEIPEHKH